MPIFSYDILNRPGSHDLMRPFRVRARSAQQGARRDRRGIQIGPRLRLGGGLGKAVNKIANTKVLGVSLGSMAGGPTLGLGTIAGQRARGGNLKDNVLGDLKSGARNAAVIAPAIGALGAAGAGASAGASAGAGAVEGVAAQALPAQGLMGGLKAAGGSLLGFAEKNPNATAGILQGLGNLAGGNSEDRLRDAEIDRLEQETGETAYDFERRKRRNEQLAPVWSALSQGASGSGNYGAANPYSVGG